MSRVWIWDPQSAHAQSAFSLKISELGICSELASGLADWRIKKNTCEKEHGGKRR